ncbi:MAG: hypothetical protein C0404_07620 [Verrucomicrobia bacterium]|nr:hypothetical protein [Verrucomicrobiota bacterium]
MVVVVILVFVVIWNFDIHKILFVKSTSQNAGDSAALVASRWQAITLNLVGDLNIMNAIAVSYGDTAAQDSISNIQARICYSGPMIGFMAAQQAAKNNGVYQNQDFTDILIDHARAVRNDYPSAVGADGEPLFPEPYPGCWTDYANMLDLVAADGVAAGPDNVRLYTDHAGGHYLLMKDYYNAVAGKIWCWFFNNAPELLPDYLNFFPCWWAPLPDIPPLEYMNSEIFGLGLVKRRTSLDSLVTPSSFMDVVADRDSSMASTNIPATTNGVAATWYCYDSSLWTKWTAMSVTGPDAFPLTGPVKAKYDYAGADAAVRIEAEAGRITPGSHGTPVTNTIVWSAAAKPFGYLNETERPNSYSIVLPAFHEVALIPIDAASSSSGGGYDIEWRRHIMKHLPNYMENGPGASTCWYCQQLVTWEQESFRQEGVIWLSTNSWRCNVPGGPGSGGWRGGGTRRGH